MEIYILYNEQSGLSTAHKTLDGLKKEMTDQAMEDEVYLNLKDVPFKELGTHSVDCEFRVEKIKVVE